MEVKIVTEGCSHVFERCKYAGLRFSDDRKQIILEMKNGDTIELPKTWKVMDQLIENKLLD